MNKKILSLILALVMLVLAVPVFALPTLATEGDQSDGSDVPDFPDCPYNTAFLENRPSIVGDIGDNSNGQQEAIVYPGSWDYISYKGGRNLTVALPLVNRRVVSIYKEKWFLCEGDTVYNYAAVYACNPTSEAKVGNAWHAYGMGAGKGRVIGTRYTAEYDGKITVSFDRLLNTQLQTELHKNVVEYAIYVGGQKVWPVNDTGAWYTVSYYGADIPASAKAGDPNYIGTVGEDLADVVNASMPGEITVSKGQTVEFLMHAVNLQTYTEGSGLADVTYYTQYASSFYLDGAVTYTRFTGAALQKGSTSSRDNRPSIEGSVGDDTDGQQEAIAYPGDWDYITYTDGTAMKKPAPLTKRLVISRYKDKWFLPTDADNYSHYPWVYANDPVTEGVTGRLWQAYAMAAPEGKVIGVRYTAAYSGSINVSFDRLFNNYIRGANYKTVMAYAIYVNGQKVWPQNDTGDWYEVSYYGDGIPASLRTGDRHVAAIGEDLSYSLNASMPKELPVVEGQTVEFLMQSVAHYSYTEGAQSLTKQIFYAQHAPANYLDGTVTYTKMFNYPAVEVGVRVDGTLSLYGTPTNCPSGAEYGVCLNGENVVLDEDNKPQFEVKIAASEADKVQTVQAYYILNGEKIEGKIFEFTMTDILREYTEQEDADVAAAAEALLAYTAAAKAYFDAEAELVTYVDPTGRDAYIAKGEGVTAVPYTGADKVSFRAMSLLLNDLVNIKIVTEGALPAGAKLEVATSASFEDAVALNGTATEDGTGTKFIMDGISAVNWSTDYYVRVVDADGKTVSDTLCYSVAAYYGRMIDSDAAAYRLKALLSNLMAFHETVAAAD